MNMKTLKKLIQLLSLGGLLVALPACTHLEKVNVKPTPLAAGTKLPARAALVLDDAFTKHQFETKAMGDKWIFPFGPALEEYAKNVSAHCFAKVTTYPSPGAAAGQDVDIILHPKALKTEQAMGVMAWSDRKFVLQVEWVARDRANKNTVWLQGITGEGVNQAGNMFTGKRNQDILFQRLFDDLSRKTVEAIQNSPELRSVATARETPQPAANHRPAGQSDDSGNLSAILAADRTFPAAVAELGRDRSTRQQHEPP